MRQRKGRSKSERKQKNRSAAYEVCHVGRSKATKHVRERGQSRTFCGKPASQVISTTSGEGIIDHATCKKCLASWDLRSRRAAVWLSPRAKAVLLLDVGAMVIIGSYAGLWWYLYSNLDYFPDHGPVFRIVLISFVAALLLIAFVVSILIPIFVLIGNLRGRSRLPRDYAESGSGSADASIELDLDIGD